MNRHVVLCACACDFFFFVCMHFFSIVYNFCRIKTIFYTIVGAFMLPIERNECNGCTMVDWHQLRSSLSFAVFWEFTPQIQLNHGDFWLPPNVVSLKVFKPSCYITLSFYFPTALYCSEIIERALCRRKCGRCVIMQYADTERPH